MAGSDSMAGMVSDETKGLSYRDIALRTKPDAEDEQLENEIRKVKRGVSMVRKIFHELFPFLPLSELI